MSGHNYFANSGALKIDMMLRGVRVGDPVTRAWACGIGGIDIELPGGTLVNIPCMEDFTKNSPYALQKKGEGHVVTDGTDTVPVTIKTRPELLSRKTATGVPLKDIASVHGSYSVITPSPRCEFFNSNAECRYCAGNYDIRKPGRDFTVEEVLEAVQAVLKEKLSEIIYFSVGFSSGDDGGIELLAPYITAVKKHFNCLVAVEAFPPKDNRWIDETYALGADSVLYNLQIFDSGIFEIVCPGRAGLIGRKRYLDALKYAAGIFPNGTVASQLIVGLEPPGSTVMGIDCLTAMGVVPILPIYRPTAGKALRIEPLTAEIIIPVYKHLYKAVKEKGINLSWVRDISMVTTPAEVRELVEGSGSQGSLMENFYKSRLGLKTAWGLSTLRRKLRVKKGEGGAEPKGR